MAELNKSRIQRSSKEAKATKQGTGKGMGRRQELPSQRVSYRPPKFECYSCRPQSGVVSEKRLELCLFDDDNERDIKKERKAS